MTTHNLRLRPSRPEDEPAIRTLFEEVDIQRLGMGRWKATERQPIIELQFRARQRHFQTLDEDQKECVIEVGGEFAGRIIVVQSALEIRLADLALHQKFQGMGIGRAIIETTRQEAIQSKRPLRLMVEKLNPARTFYEKLGFYQTDDNGAHVFMEWTPAGPKGTKLHFFGDR